MSETIAKTHPTCSQALAHPAVQPVASTGGTWGGAILLRYAGYTLFMFAVTYGLILMIAASESFDQASFREGGVVERTQFVIAAASALLAWCGACVPRRRDRAFLVALGAVIAVAACRELDSWFKALPLLHWSYPATVCWAVVVLAFWRGGAKAAAMRWLATSGGAICWAGFICVVVLAQLFGQVELWQGVMGNAYERVVKIVAEESIELFGYALVLLGTAETLIAGATGVRASEDSQPEVTPPTT